MEFLNNHLGEFSALLVAVFWTISAIAFESASRRVGSLQVNLLRLIIGMIFLSFMTLIRRKMLLPLDAGGDNWLWLGLSGLVGFVFGDLLLFKSFTIIGSRFAMLVMTLVPPITAFFGWIILSEKLTLLNFAGIALTLTGIALAVFKRNENGDKISLKLSPAGILYAFGGAVGQALGLVLSKVGLTDYDPFAGTQIRVIAGIAGFAMLVTVMKRWGNIRSALRDTYGMKSLTLGAFFGPFLGVSFSLISVKFAKTGIASTIMALTPIFILIPAYFMYRQKVTLPEIIGSVISVCGVALFFI
jgi:drug/metabolite transporter (DMT)-like permease